MKGNINFGILSGAALSLVVLALLVGFGLMILEEVAENMDNTSTAYTAVGTIIDGIATIPDWVGILVVVLMGTFILGLFLAGRVFSGR